MGKGKPFTPGRPRWPMSITGKEDSIVRGEREVFSLPKGAADEGDAGEGLDRTVRSCSRERPHTTAAAPAVRRRTAAAPPPLPPPPPPPPRPVPLDESALRYMPRHTADRLRAKAAKEAAKELEAFLGQGQEQVPPA